MLFAFKYIIYVFLAKIFLDWNITYLKLSFQIYFVSQFFSPCTKEMEKENNNYATYVHKNECAGEPTN